LSDVGIKYIFGLPWQRKLCLPSTPEVPNPQIAFAASGHVISAMLGLILDSLIG
jgi:hypothetical protein